MAKAKRSKSILNDQSYRFLKTYINNPSPTGFESGGQKLWIEYVKPFVDTHFTDPYGTAVGVINPDAPFKVVIEAHADEISWFVNYIAPEGLIYLKRNGGVDHQIAPSMRVLVHGKKGAVKAVFGWPAGTVASRKHRALAQLREELEALGIEAIPGATHLESAS